MTFVALDHPRDTASGRFVTSARNEPPAQMLQGPQIASRLYDIADELAFTTKMTDQDKEHARARAMEWLQPLPDAEERWESILHAVEQWSWFEDEDEGDLRAGEELTSEQTLDVDIDDFAGYNEPDRDGENGYMGYHFREYADALADAWRCELEHRTQRAAQAITSQRL